MILICDTNIFLQPTVSSHLDLMRYFIETKRFYLGLTETILREYSRFGVRSRHLQEINKRIQAGRLWRTVDLSSITLSGENQQKLSDLCVRLCFGVRVETQRLQEEIGWLRVALAHPGVTIVYVDSILPPTSIPRLLIKSDMVEKIKDVFPGLQIKSCDAVVKELRLLPEGVPRDLAALNIWLDR